MYNAFQHSLFIYLFLCLNLTYNLKRFDGLDDFFLFSDMGTVQQDIIELVRGYPEGIPVKKLAVSFNKKYRRNLTLSKLGFSSIGNLVDSIADLVVENDVVFHRSHRIKPHAASSLPPTPPMSATPPLHTTVAAAAAAASIPGKDPQPAMRMVLPAFGVGPLPTAAELTQEQLLEKVQEVVRHYPVAGTSIVQLQNSYFLHFGTPLPMNLYLPLYHRLVQASVAATASKPVEANGQAETLSLIGNY